MSCGCQPPNTGAAYASCVGQTIVDPEPDSTLQMYAGRVGAPTTGKCAWVNCLVAAFLLTRRMIYFKQQPGDCGRQTSINLGVSGAVGAGLAVGAAGDPEPISRAVLTGLATIFGVFTAHHAQAVRVEQATLCDVANSYNQNAYALEQLVQAGQMDPVTAGNALAQVASGLHSYLDSIKKPCNAAYGFAYALDALVLYNTEVVFPALYRAPAVAVPYTPAAPGSPSALAPLPSPQNPNAPTPPYGSKPVDLTSAIDQLAGQGGTGTVAGVSTTTLLVFAAAGLVVIALS